MITVEKALETIDSSIRCGESEILELHDVTGRVCAEKVVSPIQLPPFDQSAMDGYAVRFYDQPGHYTLVGEIAAGSAVSISLNPGEAVRIFTGARIPQGADAVVMQEMCKVNHNIVTVEGSVKAGDHIRKAGNQIKSGETAFEKNTLLSPFATGFIAALGLDRINVFRQPRVAVISTGSELIKPGTKLQEGKIYESNSYMLQSAIRYYTNFEAEIYQVHDDLQKTTDLIQQLLPNTDFILLSGGISAGEYDFVARALEANKVKGIFYKVLQKPGKPLYFGMSENNTAVFALPGNPGAAITSFLVYVLPALKKFAGHGFNGLRRIAGQMKESYIRNDDRAHLLKAAIQNGVVTIQSGQNSDILKSFMTANCIAYIPATVKQLQAGDSIDVFLL